MVSNHNPSKDLSYSRPIMGFLFCPYGVKTPHGGETFFTRLIVLSYEDVEEIREDSAERSVDVPTKSGALSGRQIIRFLGFSSV